MMGWECHQDGINRVKEEVNEQRSKVKKRSAGLLFSARARRPRPRSKEITVLSQRGRDAPAPDVDAQTVGAGPSRSR